MNARLRHNHVLPQRTSLLLGLVDSMREIRCEQQGDEVSRRRRAGELGRELKDYLLLKRRKKRRKKKKNISSSRRHGRQDLGSERGMTRR